MSPCCKTFSKADSSNVGRGHNYRNHRDPTRPPKDQVSDKGREAVAADAMVQKGIRVARWCARVLGTVFYLENPVGSLARRPYMGEWVKMTEGWEMPVRRREVHYCAYAHMYHKPTHIWTNLFWEPKGETGTGKCDRKCWCGERGTSGKWVHRFKIAQGSHQAAGGLGRKARKNMLPRALHLELLEAAGVLVRWD